MENRVSRGRKWAVIVLSLALPFVCGLVDILLTGDQVPTQPLYWWLMRIQQLGSVLISILFPLAILAESGCRMSERIVTSLRFGGVWFLTQSIALCALAVISIALYPDPYP